MAGSFPDILFNEMFKKSGLSDTNRPNCICYKHLKFASLNTVCSRQYVFEIKNLINYWDVV